MSTIELASPEKKDIRSFFDAIANRYDLVNSFLSFRLDHRWRKKSRDLLLEHGCTSLLDIGTGTGKYLKLFLEAKVWDLAVGLDFSKQMLAEAKRDLPVNGRLVVGDLHELPFENHTFDLVISSFTLRSVKDMPCFLREVYRVLRHGGKASFLCLTRPNHPLSRAVYYPYLKYYLPLAGAMISRHQKAYRFLSESIQHFQDPAETMKMMEDRGFSGVTQHPLTMGAATLIVGNR